MNGIPEPEQNSADDKKPRIDGHPADMARAQAHSRDYEKKASVDVDLRTRNQNTSLKTQILATSSSESIQEFLGDNYFRSQGMRKTDAIVHLAKLAIVEENKHARKGKDWLYAQLRNIGFGKEIAIECDIVAHAYTLLSKPNAKDVCHMLDIDGSTRIANGETVLMHAIKKLPMATVEALIQDGGSLLATDDSGISAINLAMKRIDQYKLPEFKSLILEHLFDELEPIFTKTSGLMAEKHIITDAKHFEDMIIKTGLTNVYFHQVRNKNGKTIIDIFVENGYEEHLDAAMRLMDGGSV